jgi:hypothetical protein
VREKLRKIILILEAMIILSLVTCQEGLAPDSGSCTTKKSFLNGIIKYKGGKERFPDSSMIFGIYVAAFKEIPEDSAGILHEILSGNVYVEFESEPYPVDSSEFSLEISDAPVNIEYIACTMQTDSSDYLKQRVIGIYTQSGDNTKPSELMVETGKTYRIIINVDFDNLPPQPF